MKRCLLAVVIGLAFCGAVTVGDPPQDLGRPEPAATEAPQPARLSPTASLVGRRKLEARLQAPAEIDFAGRQSVSARELLDQLHTQHHLSIRFDIPTFAALFGVPDAVAKKTPEGRPSCPTACYLPDDVRLFPAAPAFASPQVVVPAQAIVAAAPAAVRSNNSAVTLAAAAAPTAPAVARPTPAPAGAPALGAPAPSVTPPAPAAAPKAVPPLAPVAPAAPPTSLQTGEAPVPATTPAPLPSRPSLLPQCPGELTCESAPDACADSADNSPAIPDTREALEELLGAEIDIQTIDLKSVSVATVLRLALDAAPIPSGAADFGGLPIALTDAMLLDYVVEDDGLVITTRMKALTQKETRVYSVKHLHDLPPEQLAKTIRQAIRPWSWRSQIADLGEQLKGTPLPAETFGSLLKTGVQLVGAELGATVTMTDDSQAADKDEKKDDGAQASAMLGNAIVNGLVTFVQATLSTLEMFHYAEPPTATIQTLPGKLVITQSQAAHREIAELLSQLGEE